MSRNIDRWVCQMRDAVTGLANRQEQPDAAEVRAAREFVREWVFKSVVARFEKQRQPRTDKAKLAAAKAVLEAAGVTAPPDTRERFLEELQRVGAAQREAEVLRDDLEARRAVAAKQRERRLKLVESDGDGPAQSEEKPARERHTGVPLVGPGLVADDFRRAVFAATRWRAPGH